MERDGAEAEGAEEDGEALGFVDGAGEDDAGLACEGGAEQVGEVVVLELMRDEEVVLQEGADGLVFICGDGDAGWVAQGGALEGFDFRGHCCGEEVCVPGGAVREDFEDFVDYGAKVEVEEAVGFVHDEVLQVFEGEAFGVFEVVEEAAGGGDDDVRFFAESDGLWYHVHSSD